MLRVFYLRLDALEIVVIIILLVCFAFGRHQLNPRKALVCAVERAEGI